MCVGVSVEGLRSPSTTLPSRSTTTMSEAFIDSYDTPLGLITTSPLERSMPLTFPHVSVTRPCFGSARFAASTVSRVSSSTGSDLLVLQVQQLGDPPPAPAVLAEIGDEVVWRAEGKPVVHERLHPALGPEVEVVHLDFRK